MQISNFAIDRPRIVTICTILVLMIAVYSMLMIPVQRTPALTKAVVIVAIPYPDAGPSQTENEIARKVEDALTDLQSVDYITSNSLRGSNITTIVFLDGIDPVSARSEVKELVDRILNELPLGRFVQPKITDIDFENAPLMLVNITAPEGYDNRTLRTNAEEIQKQLELVEGISNTQLFGGREREIHVNIYPDRMAQYGLTLQEINTAIENFHAKVPAGSFNTGHVDRNVRNESKLRNLSDIREVIVRNQDGRIIYLKDIAMVIDTHQRIKSIAHVNGEECATLIVNKESGINTLGASRAIKAKIAELRVKYPDLTIATTRNTSEEIWVMFRVLGSSALFGAMLVLIILAWTMGLRISVLVLIAIPFSCAVGLIFLYATGIPISNMVVFSYILVLGMVVDGAIIVAENIHRHIERGEDPVTAAKVGIAEVGVPVIAADLTTIAAFLPMLLVPGIMGDFLGVMPKVVTVALIGSILVDHFVIPTAAARWYRRRKVVVPRDVHKKVQAEETAPGNSSIHAVTSPAQNETAILSHTRPNLGFFTQLYARLLQASLNNRIFVVVWCGCAMWGTSLLFGHLGFEFFPPSDRGMFNIKYELPLGYSIDETIAASKAITEPLKKWEETGILRHYVTTLGPAGGMGGAQVGEDPATGPEFGEIMVELVSPLDRTVHESEVIADLRQNIHPIPGMKFRIKEIEDGPPGGSPVSIRLTGKSLTQLGSVSKLITVELAKIEGTRDAASDYRSDNPELVIEPNANIIGQFGFTDLQIARAIQTAIAGNTTHQVVLNDKDITLRVQLAPQYQKNTEDLERMMLTSPDGRKATIKQLADIRRDVSLFSINRHKRNRAVTASCDVVEELSPDDVFKVLRNKILPALGFVPVTGTDFSIQGNTTKFIGTETTPSAGLLAEFTGENEERDKNFRYLLYSMIIAIVLIFGILVMQFNSFRQAGVVMVAVPLSFIGVVLGSWFCQFPFSLASFIGLVSLTGIVVNDAIVLVDFTNQARKRGLGVREAVLESGINRLRPVLLTTVTTIGGLLPLFLNISGGAEFWQPLTGAVVFGLAFATVLTLIVIPCFYSFSYNRPTFKECFLGVVTLLLILGSKSLLDLVSSVV